MVDDAGVLLRLPRRPLRLQEQTVFAFAANFFRSGRVSTPSPLARLLRDPRRELTSPSFFFPVAMRVG